MKELSDNIGDFFGIMIWGSVSFGVIGVGILKANVDTAFCLGIIGFLMFVGILTSIEKWKMFIPGVLVSLSIVFFALSYIQTYYPEWRQPTPEILKATKNPEQYSNNITWQRHRSYLNAENCLTFGYYTGAGGLTILGIFALIISIPDFGRKWKTNKEIALMRQNFDSELVDEEFFTMMKADTHLGSALAADPDLSGKIQMTMDLYNPKAGLFTNWIRRIRSNSRTETLTALNKEQKLLIEQAAMLEQKVLDGQTKRAEFQMFIARNAAEFLTLKNKAALDIAGLKEGMSGEAISDVNKQKKLSELFINEETAKTKLQMERERYQYELRMKEHEAKAKLEQNLKISQSEYILEKTHEQSQKKKTALELRREIQEAIIERDKIKNRDDISEEAKEELLEVENDYIKGLKKQLNDRHS